MNTWNGQVTKITKTPWQDIVLWSFKINTSARTFRMGKKEPAFKEGEWISFTEKNSSVDYDSIRDVPAETAGEVQPPVTTGAGALPVTEVAINAKQRSGNDMSDSVGDRIRFQAARADACNIIVAALAADHLPHASNVAKGKRLDLLLGYVKEVTNQLLAMEASNESK
jgi:hypothetical protein